MRAQPYTYCNFKNGIPLYYFPPVITFWLLQYFPNLISNQKIKVKNISIVSSTFELNQLSYLRKLIIVLYISLFAVPKQYLMVTQGYPTSKATLSEVIDASNPKKACKPLIDLDNGDHIGAWYAGFGGVIDGVIVVCGGFKNDSKDCFAYKNHKWTRLATLKQGRVPSSN